MLIPLPKNQTPQRTWGQLFVRGVGYDFFVAIPVSVVWAAILGWPVLAPVIGLTLLRLFVEVVVIRRVFAVLGPWHARGTELDDDQLLDTDQALARGPRQFARWFSIGWLLVFGAIVASAQTGVLQLTVGLAEYLMAGLLLASVLVAAPPVLTGLLDPALLDDRANIGDEIAARGLITARAVTSFVGSLTWLNTRYALAVCLGMAGLAGQTVISGERAVSGAERLRVAERGAAQARAREAVDAGVVLASTALLPPQFDGRDLDALQTDAVAVFDVERSVTYAAAPVGDGRIVLATAEVDEHLGLMLAILLVIAIFVGAPPLYTTRSAAGAVARQLDAVRAAIERVLGNGQLRGIPRFRAPRNDEVGLLALEFNILLDVLEELAAAAHGVAEGDLSANLDRPSDLHNAFRGMLERLREVVGQIQRTALELASAGAEIQAAAHAHERAAIEQASSVSEVGATIATLASAAHDITDTAAQVLDNAEQTVANSDETLATIGALNRQAGSISELLEVIREIADRSDLLALNGSLEATRAGEAGRGFALVAAEMRRLAERVGGSVTDVRRHVADIGNTSAITVTTTRDGRELAQRTATAAREIAKVTATQSRDTQRVSSSIRSLGESVSATVAATSQTRAAAEGLQGHARELERLTLQFAALRRDQSPG